MTQPIAPNGEHMNEAWQQVLQAGPACLVVERFGEPLTAEEQAHVASCARCRTELEMFSLYEANEPLAGEGLSVAWIAQRARRAVQTGQPLAPPTPVPARKVVWGLPRWALAAASVAVIVGGATLLWRPPVTVEPTAAGEIYRTVRVEVLSPAGDIAGPPVELRVAAIPGAVAYEVRLLEVDGTELWREVSPVSAIPVPPAIAAAALPAKTLVWQVVAKDNRQRVLADSGDVRFRVQPR